MFVRTSLVILAPKGRDPLAKTLQTEFRRRNRSLTFNVPQEVPRLIVIEAPEYLAF
jgi:hypothetical protein